MDEKFLKNVYSQDPNIVSREVAGELILVPIRNQVADMDYIYTLNATGASVWALLDGQRNLAEIQARLVSEYEVEPDQAAQDLADLIDALLETGAIIKVE